MLKHEFEDLYGSKVGENEFEVINAFYMLNNDENKQEFVTRYKKMSKDDLMSAFVALNKISKNYSNGQTARAVEAEREVEKLKSHFNTEIAELKRKHEDFVKTIAVQCHDYDESIIEGECYRELGALTYFKTLRDAGCEPTRNDLEMAIKAMEE